MSTSRGFPPPRRGATAGWNPLWLAALTGLWLAVLPNWPLWRALVALPETDSWRGAIFVAGFGVMIASLTTAVLSLAAWRHTIKPAAVFLVVAAAIGAHFMGAYGGVIDTTMMRSTLQTNVHEVGELLNVRLIVDMTVLGVLPLIVIARMRLSQPSAGRQCVRNAAGFVGSLLLLCAAGASLFADLSGTMRNHPSLRYRVNPLNSLYALVDLGIGAHHASGGTLRRIGLDARPAPRPAGARPPLVLLVIGETARADHFSLNGYARPTNPELASLGVASFTQVTSCGTNTAASLPCMFSARGKAAFEAAAGPEENLLDLVQRAGYAVLWVDNQAGCKNVCDRVPRAFAADPVSPGRASSASALTAAVAAEDRAAEPAPSRDAAGATAPLCKDGECLDEALLVGLEARLDALPAAERARGVLLVLHQMGSHGPAYFKRSPPDRKPFQPECKTNVLRDCSKESLVNAYDNSIAYTDHVVASAVRWLAAREKEYDGVLAYVSDHGESLGANGLYLHGLPYTLAPKEQVHVPMVFWAPPQAGRDGGVSMTCLQHRRGLPLSHDNLFHSVVGLLRLEASEYRPALDAFAPCRRP